MAQLDVLDVVVLLATIVGTTLYFGWGTIFGKKDSSTEEKYKNGFGSGSGSSSADTRDIVAALEKNDKDVIIFYGSQTGTAEDYASRLAKEASAVYGLKTMTASLEDYDFENLDAIPENKVVGFVMATYGEGEPTDTAFQFYEFLTSDGVEFSQGESSLENLKYVVFGLGNSTYEHYNAVGRRVNKIFEDLGAKRIGPYGEGDDGSGTMEEDYLSWKDELFQIWKELEGLEEREAVYEPVLDVFEVSDLEGAKVYEGEPNKAHLEGTVKAPYSATNPLIAPIVTAKELFESTDRNCIHLELDTTGLKYNTGDHLALLAPNSNEEVARFLKIFNLEKKSDTVVDVKFLDPTAKVPFPTPTTYDAIVRYHLEINGPVSRQFLFSIAPFAPSEEAKKTAQRLGSSKEDFHKEIASEYLNTAQALSKISKEEAWSSVPFSFIVESINHLVPRYYSISSSSKESPSNISITAVVESIKPKTGDNVLKGVATNYILDLKHTFNKTTNPDPTAVHYDVAGPRGVLGGNSVYAYVRHSNFKLPSNPKKPVIMVGPGTGVAPFRGFVHERAYLAAQGAPVGPALLFFGCRNSKEDFLYRDEWKEYSGETPADLLSFVQAQQAEEDLEKKKFLGPKSFLKLVTAFSRESTEKVYVQHRLEEQSALVNALLKQGAFFYVCGDATRMARDVQAALVRIISKERNISKTKAEEIVKNMRTQNLYQEDVW
ncbi:uncharacterized protein SAPINGB_P001433 [Magnusiomyces paraingens]|uniref:NADPH--cytochrome P450 reductase n=1 Tax=Magnusiomyces paraingens TaxID=2606893 RepID=A0A5E8B682_9ASCO|nr:uncharacterized protein SAPINGB_P001433 [Saprochaete ingens]VVT46879.1 unnamed protein product [Saprochaete ingens]